MDDDYTPTIADVEHRYISGKGKYTRKSFHRWLAYHVAEVRAATKAEQRESDAVITDGPHPANSGLDSFTLAHIGFTIRAAGKETGGNCESDTPQP